MISRRRCRQIAEDWCREMGVKEWNRRMASIRAGDEEMAKFAASIGKPFHINQAQRVQLASQSAEMLVGGYYDPPVPKIPGFFTRLRLRDWTPPLPTRKQWPMGHEVADAS